MRACRAIDDGGGRDPDARLDLAAAVRIARSLAWLEQGDVPEGGSAVRIEGIDRVVLGRDEHGVMRAPADGELRKIQRLRVHLAIDLQRSEQSETRRIDVGRR